MLIWQNLRGAPGELVELLTSSQGPQSAISIDVPIQPTSFGLQAAWAIDPATGSDSNQGTPAAPLATMGELSSRLTGPSMVRQPTTVQIVGNVVDSPLLLAGIRLASGASLAFSGVRTQLVAGITISAVTLLGVAFPWQITTAGVDWTVQPLGAQIRFSNATVSPIIQVIDANNVVVNPTAASAGTTAPTTALTASVETIPSILPPCVQGVEVPTGSTVFTSLSFTDLSISGGGSLSVSGLSTLLQWCEVKPGSSQWLLTAFVRAVGCRFTLATGSTFRVRSAPTQFLANGGAFVGDAGASPIVVMQGGQTQLVGQTLQNARLQVIDQGYCQYGSFGIHFRNVSAAPLTIDGNATLYTLNTNSPINGGGGGGGGTNVGVAITINAGRLLYTGAGSKPTMTATAANDVRLGNGGPLLTYAAIAAGGQIDATVNGAPPALTSTTLVRAGIALIGQMA